MCVCLCVCVHVCMHVCMCLYKHVGSAKPLVMDSCCFVPYYYTCEALRTFCVLSIMDCILEHNICCLSASQM